MIIIKYRYLHDKTMLGKVSELDFYHPYYQEEFLIICT